MTEQFYGDDSVRIKKTAKEEWVQSEFREQERYRRNYYGTIFLEILLDKMQQKERVLYIETVKAPRVVRIKRRKKDLDPKKCDEVERQKETVTKNCDAHKPKESMVSGTRSVPPAQNVQDMPVVPEIRLSNGAEKGFACGAYDKYWYVTGKSKRRQQSGWKSMLYGVFHGMLFCEILFHGRVFHGIFRECFKNRTYSGSKRNDSCVGVGRYFRIDCDVRTTGNIGNL